MLAENELPLLADKLKPYIVPWLPKSSTSGIGGGGGSLSTHDIGGSYHSGTLRSDQAPQFALLDGSRVFTGSIVFVGAQTVDGVDLSVHVADANAHHAQATIGANSGLTLSGQLFNMGTPGGLSATSANAVSGASHTHAIDSTIARSAITITGGGALGGGGALTTNQVVTMNLPGSLSATSTNSSATNHTHTIDSTIARSAINIGVNGLGLSGGGNLTADRTISLTSSSAPGAAASILASDATGKLTLPLFVATSSVTTPSLITASGDLSVTPAGSNIAIANSKTIQSNYVSGWSGSGYRIDSNVSVASQSFAEFDNLSVRGTLSVYELVINQIRATNGTLIVSSAGKIDSVSGGNWTFEDPNSSNLCPFAVDDLVIIQEVDVNASTLIKRIVRRVSAVAGKTITVVAATGGPADTGAAAAGDTVVRIGNVTNVARRGSVLITSDMSNSPYTDTISGVTSWADWTGGTKTRVRMGHLSGITGTANEYGLIAGNGFTTADSWVKFSTVAVTQNNVDSGWYNSGTKIVVINTAKGIDINASGTGYDAVRSYSFSDGTTYRGGLQAYLNAGETQVEMHSLGPGVTSIATVLAENTATTATAQVEIAATNNQAAKTASISLIASGAAHEVDVSADLIALVANKIHITNGTAADGSASAPILSFLNDTNTGFYRPVADQIGISTGGVERVAITTSTVSVTNKLYTGTIVEVGQGQSTSNVSKFTGRLSTYAGISLATSAYGYASAVLFNAYHANTSISMFTSGASKYLGAQYTGYVSRPGMFQWDANGGIFSLAYGEAGLANEADITTWTKILEAGTGGLKVIGNVGFNNTAPISKPTVSGSRGGNAALASLLTALANYGLIVNSTT